MRDDSEHLEILNTSLNTGGYIQEEKRAMAEINNPIVRKKLLVAAIDFGTTFSGYAFSFLHEFKVNPLDIKVNQWLSRNLISHKTPTIILLRPDKTFHSFGYEAEKKYSELTLDEEHSDWLYFRRFKMELYRHGGLSRHLQLTADNGKVMPAMTIVSMSIEFMKDHLVEALQKRVHNITAEDIYWVLTIPAIWNDAAKQFMREAAVDAGIQHESLSLCLEPEAASIYCQNIPFEKSASGIEKFEEGTTYMVLDLGGGTADITVHQIAKDHSIIELQKAGGGAWGGAQVDSLFSSFLQRTFGKDVYEKFKSKNPFDNMELEQEFELLKRRVSTNAHDKETIRIPATFTSEFKSEMDGVSPSEAIQQTSYRRRVKFIGDKLRMDAGIIHELYSSTAENIIRFVKHLNDDIQKNTVKCINSLIVVGGLSESKVIQKAIREAFPDKVVVVPSEPELSVLKGAVLFGYNPKIISARVAKCTYGTAGFMRFVEGHHPVEKRVNMDGKDLCEDCFIKFVELGQTLPINTIVGNKRYSALRDDQKLATVPIFTSTEKNPRFVTDSSCTLLGVLQFAFTKDEASSGPKIVIMKMIFGNVELSVEASEEHSGKTVKIRFDCLS